MKLYYAPGACSLSPHILLREAGLAFDLEKVDLAAKKTASGEDYLSANPNGYVPLLVLDNGEKLAEGIAIALYLASLAPEGQLAPAPGSMAYIRLIEMLAFISTELHKGFGPLFKPNAPDAWKNVVKETLAARLTQTERRLGSKSFVMGDRFTVADAYLFVVLSWGAYVGVDLKRWPALAAYSGRIAARPAVQVALKAEGLIPG
ncbi:MAG: glutathione transferase GstA [Panacagrimonas sp.]